ncbi:MAG: hypothetical protein QXT48_04515 [Thermoplasmatales archaeon]
MKYVLRDRKTVHSNAWDAAENIKVNWKHCFAAVALTDLIHSGALIYRSIAELGK